MTTATMMSRYDDDAAAAAEVGCASFVVATAQSSIASVSRTATISTLLPTSPQSQICSGPKHSSPAAAAAAPAPLLPPQSVLLSNCRGGGSLSHEGHKC
ncbi:hypothetical protein BO78DRAFT_401608 [Aspergillus sclerotiicarbonarius CBS 121057]|uniref:Uncharacterized protein n=1 Tax=Aspergillus sclerotiicarbonarius (strain CBS 121057 / IBT 28362) TaxID=1448318 RepID=A0A319F6T4_ASPSB|nr:hypothetical protein BO78DRAFT_401608 [Aspergillus sclerotiicarbonarius CBS 121057]